MNAICKSISLTLCLALSACGNKGDLYLNPIELTEEQKALLDEIDGKKTKKKKNTETNEPAS